MLLSFAVFLLLLLLGMPVVFAIGIGGLVFFLTQPGLQLTMPVQLALAETQNFSLLAIPTFILASNLMNELGVTRRLLRFAHVATGFMRGGLAQVSVLLGFLMGGVSGSAIADATMQARLLGPEMVRRGYSRGFIAALQGFSGLLAVAIPPRIGLIPCESQATFAHVEKHRMRSPVSPGNHAVDRKTSGATSIDEVTATLMLHEKMSVEVFEREH